MKAPYKLLILFAASIIFAKVFDYLAFWLVVFLVVAKV